VIYSRLISVPRCKFKLCIIPFVPIPVAARSNAWVCGRSSAGIVGSNPAGAWMFVCCECCVSGRGLCDKLITRPEESYRLWCVVVCDLVTSRMRRPWPTGGCCAKKKNPFVPVSVAARSNAWVCGRSPVEIGGFESRRGHGCLCVVCLIFMDPCIVV